MENLLNCTDRNLCGSIHVCTRSGEYFYGSLDFSRRVFDRGRLFESSRGCPYYASSNSNFLVGVLTSRMPVFNGNVGVVADLKYSLLVTKICTLMKLKGNLAKAYKMKLHDTVAWNLSRGAKFLLGRLANVLLTDIELLQVSSMEVSIDAREKTLGWQILVKSLKVDKWLSEKWLGVLTPQNDYYKLLQMGPLWPSPSLLSLVYGCSNTRQKAIWATLMSSLFGHSTFEDAQQFPWPKRGYRGVEFCKRRLVIKKLLESVNSGESTTHGLLRNMCKIVVGAYTQLEVAALRTGMHNRFEEADWVVGDALIDVGGLHQMRELKESIYSLEKIVQCYTLDYNPKRSELADPCEVFYSIDCTYPSAGNMISSRVTLLNNTCRRTLNYKSQIFGAFLAAQIQHHQQVKFSTTGFRQLNTLSLARGNKLELLFLGEIPVTTLHGFYMYTLYIKEVTRLRWVWVDLFATLVVALQFSTTHNSPTVVRLEKMILSISYNGLVGDFLLGVLHNSYKKAYEKLILESSSSKVKPTLNSKGMVGGTIIDCVAVTAVRHRWDKTENAYYTILEIADVYVQIKITLEDKQEFVRYKAKKSDNLVLGNFKQLTFSLPKKLHCSSLKVLILGSDGNLTKTVVSSSAFTRPHFQAVGYITTESVAAIIFEGGVLMTCEVEEPPSFKPTVELSDFSVLWAWALKFTWSTSLTVFEMKPHVCKFMNSIWGAHFISLRTRIISRRVVCHEFGQLA